MRSAAEPARAADEPVKSERTPARGKAPTPSRPQSEAATLVCAIAVAVLMGIACGAWINARLASAASPASAAFVAPPAPAYLLPIVPAVETPPAPANAPDETSETLSTRPSAPADKKLGRPAAGPVKPSASEVRPSAKTHAEIPTAAVAGAKPKAVRGQGSPAPCALYASADSLNIRGGGAATLVVGGPGGAGHVTATTPDWSNIAVFSEGRTGGNGWFRYSVRSVGKKSGVYSVRFTTPCGSRNIRVTVVQP